VPHAVTHLAELGAGCRAEAADPISARKPPAITILTSTDGLVMVPPDTSASAFLWGLVSSLRQLGHDLLGTGDRSDNLDFKPFI
jgi:hypothetical protein